MRDQFRIELVLTADKLTRKPGAHERGYGDRWITKPRRVTTGTYQTLPAWLSANDSNMKRIVDVQVRSADGPHIIGPGPFREGDRAHVEITRLDDAWVCGQIAVSGPRGKLVGPFAARAR